MKTFEIMRTDYNQVLTVSLPSGISQPYGKKPVAEGMVFNSGKVVINWLGDVTSVVVHDNIENVIKIHCNGDASLIQYKYDSDHLLRYSNFGYSALKTPGTYSEAIGTGALNIPSALSNSGYGSVCIGPSSGDYKNVYNPNNPITFV